MAISYTYTKIKDTHTLKNTGSASILYTINVHSKSALKPFLKGTLEADQTFTIPFTIDGRYIITLQDTNLTEKKVLPEILIYKNSLVSFIAGTKSILCNCADCNECEDCDECKNYLDTLTKALAIYSIAGETYKKYLDQLIPEGLLQFTDEFFFCTLKEMMYGQADFKKTIERTISYYYLAFYLQEYNSSTTEDEKLYVNAKFRYFPISKCMYNKGINIGQITEPVDQDSLVYFWQLDNVSDKIEEVLAVITPEYLSEKTYTSMASYREGLDFSYLGVGRIVFVLETTQSNQYAFLDYLGNNITDTTFDRSYDSANNLEIFVSKEFYVPSSIYLKLLKL